MPGMGFKQNLIISADGSIVPEGPLPLTGDDTPVRLDIWVYQEGEEACATCVTVLHDFPDFLRTKSWKALPGSCVIPAGQRFVPGPATAMALLVTTDKSKTKTEVYYWTRAISLHQDGSYSKTS